MIAIGTLRVKMASQTARLTVRISHDRKQSRIFSLKTLSLFAHVEPLENPLETRLKEGETREDSLGW